MIVYNSLTRIYSSEYEAFKSMKGRCLYKGSTSYKYYGGKGITISAEWFGKDSFKRFLDHIGPKPNVSFTLDRIDSNGNYEPGNVRWVKWSKQATNRSNNLDFPGVYKRGEKWMAELTVNGSYVLRKRFETEKEARIARKVAEIKYLHN